MADLSQSRDPLERYGAIEQTYCEERWDAVIQEGQELLASALPGDQPLPEGLRERLQLLMAHAYLYGLGDRDSAEDLYQAVQHSGAEASLREIAMQGLQQCNLPATGTAGETAAAGAEAGAQVGPPDWSGEASAPTEPPGESPLAVLGREADRPGGGLDALAEATRSGGEGAPAPEQGDRDLGWLLGEAAATPGAAAAEGPPVMPWLEPPGTQPSPAGQGAPAGSLASEADRMAATAPPPRAEGEETPMPPAAAPPPGSMAALIAAITTEESAHGQANGAAMTPAQEGPGAGDGIGAMAPVDAETSGPFALMAEVVEEPELIAVAQADPLLAEELELRLEDGRPRQEGPTLPLSHSGDDRPPWREGEQSGSEGSPQAAPGARPGNGVEGRPSRQQRGAGRLSHRPGGSGPFAAPPEPVAEEEPELLMGLLKVEMG